jgi:hypothetical protein
VLQGAKTIIKRYRPIIYMEYNELTRALSKHDSKAFERFFKKYDYKIYGLEYGWKRKLKYLENLNNLNNVSDLVCVQDMLK